MARQWGEDPTDEIVRWGSQFSIHSAPVVGSVAELCVPPSSDAVSDVFPCSCSQKEDMEEPTAYEESNDWKEKSEQMLVDEDRFDDLRLRPCSLVLPSSGGFNLTAMAAEAQLRHCPILMKDLSCETADDEDNENHLTISSLTARPLIAKAAELRSRKVARKLREAERRACVRRFKPPDGGYGWAVVVGAFMVHFWVSGLVKSYGVLFVEVLRTFSDTSAAVAAWIPAILSTLCLALAPVASALCQKFTCRTVVFIGGLFCAAGLITSSFATSPLHLLLSFGVLTGIGGGLSTTPGVLIVSRYFDKHRALANGICISGTAAGSVMFPILIRLLMETYGFHGTTLLMGGCMFHVCVSAALYRPLAVHQRLVERAAGQPIHCETFGVDITVQCEDPLQGTKQLEFLFINDPPSQHTDNGLHKSSSTPNLQEGATNDNTQSVSDAEEDRDKVGELLQVKPIFIRSCSILHSVEDLSTDSTCVYKDKKLEQAILLKIESAIPEIAHARRKKSISERVRRYLDLSLLRNLKFIIMCCSVTLMSTGCPYMLFFLPAHASSTGYSDRDAALLMVVSAAFDFVGRLGFGWISDHTLFDRRKGYISSILGAGLAVLIVPAAANYYVLASLAGMYGLCLGSWFLLVPVLLADDYGTTKISSTYGLVRLFQSFASISIPLTGYLKDVTGSYDVCFYFMGTCMMLGGILKMCESLALGTRPLPRLHIPFLRNKANKPKG